MLFILLADMLSRMIQLTKSKGIISGASPPNTSENIQCLQYMDDPLIFLQCPKTLSGLKINIGKTQILGMNLSKVETQNNAKILGDKASNFSVTYLGIPLHT